MGLDVLLEPDPGEPREEAAEADEDREAAREVREPLEDVVPTDDRPSMGSGMMRS